MFAQFVVAAIIAAPEEFLARGIRKLKEFVEKDLAAVATREARTAAAEHSALEARWEMEAKAKNIRELITEIESAGVRLNLPAEDDDRIVCTGGQILLLSTKFG